MLHFILGELSTSLRIGYEEGAGGPGSGNAGPVEEKGTRSSNSTYSVI